MNPDAALSIQPIQERLPRLSQTPAPSLSTRMQPEIAARVDTVAPTKPVHGSATPTQSSLVPRQKPISMNLIDGDAPIGMTSAELAELATIQQLAVHEGLSQ